MASGSKGWGGLSKHHKSGTTGPSPRQKQNAAREATREIAETNARQQRRKSVGITAGSVSEALQKGGR